MPLLRNKFQPYFPDPDSPNNYQCGSERYCHPVTIGDTVYSQFIQTPCNPNEVCDPEFDDYTLGPELVVDGYFTTCPGAWTLFGTSVTCGTNQIDFLGTGYCTLTQTLVGLVSNTAYQVQFTISNRTSGCIAVQLGSNVLGTFSDNGTYTISGLYTPFGGIQFQASWSGSTPTDFCSNGSFNGSIDNVSVKQISYTCWDQNGSWNLSDGTACHIQGQTGDLDQTGTNYVDAGVYYKVQFTVSGRSQGDIVVYAADANTGAISENGQYTYWLNPTINGVVTVGATSDFDGCISNIAVYELRNDYTAEIVDSNGTAFDVSDAFSYYEDYVTLGFQFDDYELSDGCYTLNVYDYCIVNSDNLVINGDFASGFDNWTKYGQASQFAIVSDELKFIFDPFGIGDTDYVTNGDFSSGAAWTLNAGWAILGGKAVHTPGNTGTLFQTMTLPTPPLGTNYNYWVKFTVSNWTTGTITLKLGTDVGGTSYTWKGNDVFLQFYKPKQSGSVDIIFTPSSTFDGEIDNVACVKTNHSAFPYVESANQPLYTPGNYQTEWEIMSSSDSAISVRSYLVSGIPTPSYESVVGSYSKSQSYALTGGKSWIVANFSKTSPNYVQTNYVEGDITVDNIVIYKTEPFDATYTSECLQYNSNGFARTKMIVGWCDQSALGFEFQNTGFKLQQRAEVRSINPNYPKSTTIMKMGTGNARIAYSEVEKYWQLHTGFASETFHDTMAAIISCDHFQIGDTEGEGIEYIAEAEDYTPNWQGDGTYTLATAVVNLRVKEKGQLFNRHI